MPFDDRNLAKQYDGFMSDYFATTYGEKETLFFANTLFACDEHSKPVATCSHWKAYGQFNTIQWFKVLKTMGSRHWKGLAFCSDASAETR
jgi:hypothetical protein